MCSRSTLQPSILYVLLVALLLAMGLSPGATAENGSEELAPILQPRSSEAPLITGPCWPDETQPPGLDLIYAFAERSAEASEALRCLLPLLVGEDKALAQAAAAVLDHIVYRNAQSAQAASVAAALQAAWRQLAPAEGLPQVRWEGGPWRLVLTARQLHVAALEWEAKREVYLNAQRKVVTWLGLCGSDGDIAQLVTWSLGPALKRESYLAMARIGGPKAVEALSAAAQRGLPEERALALAAAETAGLLYATDPALTAQIPGASQRIAATIRATAGEAPASTGTDAAGRLENVNNTLRQAHALAAQDQPRAAVPLLKHALSESVTRRQTRAALHQLARIAPEEARSPALSMLQDPTLSATARAVLVQDQAPGAEAALDRAYGVGNEGVRAGVLDVLVRRDAEGAQALLSRASLDNSAVVRFMAAKLQAVAPDHFDALETAERGPLWLRVPALRALLDHFHALAIGGEREEAALGFRALADSDAPAWCRAEALEGIGRVGRMDDLDFLEHYRPHPELGRAASTALARIAAGATAPEDAADTLMALRGATSYQEALEAAAATLVEGGAEIMPIAMGQGYVINWRCVGPFPRVMSLAPFLPPRTSPPPATVHSGEDAFNWVDCQTTGIPAYVDFSPLNLDDGPMTVFCYAEVVMSDLMTARVEVTAPGPWRIWINGDALGEGPGALEGQRQPPYADVLLNPGINRILLQVLRETGPERYSVRLMNRRNQPIDLYAQRMPDGGAAQVGVGSSAAQKLLESAP